MKQIRTTDRKYISWYAVVLIGFTMVWGFPNVINGFALFGGIRAIVPWIAVFLLYMLPYSLMVAELGSVFSREGGGVSSWLLKTAGPMMAFYAGWTYWVTQLPFIAQTPNNIIIAMSWIIYNLAVIVLSIDAPLRILMRGTNSDYIPKPMFRQNRHGAYINGLKLVAAIVCPLIILPVFGISGINNLVYWLVKVNSVTTPLVNLWVFAAYFLLKKRHENLELSTDYQLTKSRGFGMFLAVWCFAITAASCIAGMYSTDTFELVMNIATPVVLVGLGVIMPRLARRWNIRHGASGNG